MSKVLQIPAEMDISAFISKEAHDLKSPFNRAMGFLKLVLKGMDGPITDQAKEDLTIAYLNAQYTLTMISALVDMSRLGRGERNLTLDLHPVDYLLQQAVSEWQRKYHKENSVGINFSTPEAQIRADEILLRQCIQNWMSYVNEFVQQEARIEIQVESQFETCVFSIESSGKKLQPPPECDLTMYGFVAQKMLELHHGERLLLEETDRGAKIIARALRDAGVEVIYTGLHQTPEMIVNAAVQEDVDAIGLSILSGAHNYLFPKVVELLKKRKMGRIVVFGGGIIPDDDIPGLRKKGVDRIFTPGTPLAEIVEYVHRRVRPRA